MEERRSRAEVEEELLWHLITYQFVRAALRGRKAKLITRALDEAEAMVQAAIADYLEEFHIDRNKDWFATHCYHLSKDYPI